MRFLLVLLALIAAPAAPKMELRVTAFDTRPGAVAETEIEVSLPAASGPVTVLVPAGYAVNVTRRPGAVVGSATVTVGDVRHSALLVAASGAWKAPLPLEITVTADRLTFTPPPGATEVDLDLQDVLTNPAAPTVALWRAVAGDVEARSVVPLPQRIGLRAVASRGGVTLRGRLSAAGQARPRINVHLALAPGNDLTKAREVGVARTRADGSFAVSYSTSARALTALAYVNTYVATCAAPCVSETVSPPPGETVAVSFPP
jgi:hypothetical protein